jgi:Family of unknown function (DUF6476)
MNSDQSRASDDAPEPPRLRALRLLVTVLTATMILGLLVIVTLIVITLSRSPRTTALPAQITVPAGERTLAFTQGEGWIAVVTRDSDGVERIRLLDAKTGAERQVVVVDIAP